MRRDLARGFWTAAGAAAFVIVAQLALRTLWPPEPDDAEAA